MFLSETHAIGGRINELERVQTSTTMKSTIWEIPSMGKILDWILTKKFEIISFNSGFRTSLKPSRIVGTRKTLGNIKNGTKNHFENQCLEVFRDGIPNITLSQVAVGAYSMNQDYWLKQHGTWCSKVEVANLIPKERGKRVPEWWFSDLFIYSTWKWLWTSREAEVLDGCRCK